MHSTSAIANYEDMVKISTSELSNKMLSVNKLCQKSEKSDWKMHTTLKNGNM
jgi:hypothetical protein